MNFAVALFPTEDVQSPAELGRMAEDRGFEALLFPEHTHIPARVRRRTRRAENCRLSTAGPMTRSWR